MSLGLGKVSVDILKKYVLHYFPTVHRPALDGNLLTLSGDVVISHNPALGVPIETLGFFAFHYVACNIAMKFAVPEFAICGIYMPPESTVKDLEVIAKEFGKEASAYGVKVVGGHTGVYKGIEIPVVSVTMLGIRKRKWSTPKPGDKVLVVGEVGREAYWLYSLAYGLDVEKEFWRKLTCLPVALELLKAEQVKVMHDVSEGGIKGALLDIVNWLGIGLSIKSSDLPLFSKLNEINVDPLIAPSYGTLIALVDSEGLESIKSDLGSLNIPYSVVGEVIPEKKLLIDGKVAVGVDRSKLDELYGSLSSSDPIISCLKRVVRELERTTEFSKLIPEVGTNIVYAKENASSLLDIAGISGRMVVSLGKPKVCGKIVYGGSRYLASLLLEVMKIDPLKRACINIKASTNILKVLEKMKLQIRHVPSLKVKGICPIVITIKEDKKVYDAYYYPGAHGIEPSIVIFAKSPIELIEIVKKVSKNVT